MRSGGLRRLIFNVFVFIAGKFFAISNACTLKEEFLVAKFGGHGYGMAILFVVIGAILGGILGQLLNGVEALSSVMPYLVNTFPVFDTSAFTINLYVIQLTIGLAFAPNLMSMLGIVIALVLFRRY